jgi:predicted amidohydrolase
LFSPTIALWAVNMAFPTTSLEAWLSSVEHRLADAAAAGADLLLMPEYACSQWLSFRPSKLDSRQEVPWLAEQAVAVLPTLTALVEEKGIGLLAGTMPSAVPAGWSNRAFLFLPEGDRVIVATQDKLCLTPSEKDPNGWMLVPGTKFHVVEWQGLRIGMLICLDVELPALSERLASLDLDLLLVPSWTEREAGYWRVFSCAKARSIELQAAVCVVGSVGTLRLANVALPNVSGAAAFVPCEPILGHTGTLAELGPYAESPEPHGELLIVRSLPLDLIREMRHGAAEVWPGRWSAQHVQIG